MRPYIGIEGAIGVGKTTLAQYLSAAMEGELMLEVFEENPFLAKFYDAPECYALQTQLFFLMSRYHQHERLSQEGGVLISDYIFAKNDLFAQYTLTGDEHTLYQAMSQALAGQLIVPTLVVHLRASHDTLMERIRHRGRDYEQGASMEDYIRRLVHQYDAFFADYSAAPVLTLDTSSINIVEDVPARDQLIALIADSFRNILGGRPIQASLF